MDRLKEYLKDLNFKKRAVGGLDEEDVLRHIKKISELAGEEMESRNFADEEAVRKMQQELDESRGKLQKYREAFARLKEANEGLEVRIRELQENPPQQEEADGREGQTFRGYSEKYQELMAAVDTLHNVQEEESRRIRQEIQDGMKAEVAKVRARLRKKIEEERQAAEAEIGEKHRKAMAEIEEERRKAMAEIEEECRAAKKKAGEERRRAEAEVRSLEGEVESLRKQKKELERELASARETASRTRGGGGAGSDDGAGWKDDSNWESLLLSGLEGLGYEEET